MYVVRKRMVITYQFSPCNNIVCFLKLGIYQIHLQCTYTHIDMKALIKLYVHGNIKKKKLEM